MFFITLRLHVIILVPGAFSNHLASDPFSRVHDPELPLRSSTSSTAVLSQAVGCRIKLLCVFIPTSLANCSRLRHPYETINTNPISLARSSRADSLSCQPLGAFNSIPKQTLRFYRTVGFEPTIDSLKGSCPTIRPCCNQHRVLLQLLDTLLDTKYNTRHAFLLRRILDR